MNEIAGLRKVLCEGTPFETGAAALMLLTKKRPCQSHIWS